MSDTTASFTRCAGRLSALALALLGLGGGFAAPAAEASPHGPYTCKSGYVWRDAWGGDTVCVSPQARKAAASENSQASARRQGSGPHGPDTCKQGYVWREARPSDHVCVSPAARDRVRAENRNAVLTLEEPGGVPAGSVYTYDTKDQITCYMWGAAGSGQATPHAQYWFWSVHPKHGTIRAGVATADANGKIAPRLLRNVYRRYGPLGITTLALDTSTGIVTRAGFTNSYGEC